jgi:hypothetical protein
MISPMFFSTKVFDFVLPLLLHKFILVTPLHCLRFTYLGLPFVICPFTGIDLCFLSFDFNKCLCHSHIAIVCYSTFESH